MEPCNDQVNQYDASGISKCAEPCASEKMSKIRKGHNPAYRRDPSERESRCDIQQEAQPSEMVVAEQGGHHADENKRER